MAKISQYHGLRFSKLNDPIPGKYGRVNRADAEVAGGQRHAAADVDALPVYRHHGDDLTERERDDRDVVARAGAASAGRSPLRPRRR